MFLGIFSLFDDLFLNPIATRRMIDLIYNLQAFHTHSLYLTILA